MNTWEFLGLFWREFRRWVILKNPMQLQSLGPFRLLISIEGVVLSMNRRHCSDLLTILEKESWSGVAWFPWKWMWRGCFWLRNWQRRCKGARHGRRHWWKCRRRPKQAGRQAAVSFFFWRFGQVASFHILRVHMMMDPTCAKSKPSNQTVMGPRTCICWSQVYETTLVGYLWKLKQLKINGWISLIRNVNQDPCWFWESNIPNSTSLFFFFWDKVFFIFTL